MRINWLGTFGAGQGYSGSSEEMALALDRKGVDVRVMRFSNTHESNISPGGHKLLSKPFMLGDVGIAYGFPNSFTSLFEMPFKKRIGFTMFETDRIPSGRSEWAGHTGNAADIINKLDTLFVPSRHNVQLFRESGVKIPICSIPLGVNLEQYHFIDRPERETFTFLMAGVLTIRKNPGVAIAAFLQEFKDDPNVKLILKTKSSTLGHMTFPKDWGIDIIDHNATQKEMKDLYAKADCFVFPSRGEGFGLPVLEAMATGLPTIFSANSGMSDMADERFNYPVVSVDKSPAQRFPKEWGNVGNWYETDYKKLAKRMREVVGDKKAAKEKGRLSAEWVKQQWNYDQTANHIIRAIEFMT